MTKQVTYHVAVEVASRRLPQDANSAEDGGQLQSQEDEDDDDAEQPGDVTAAARAPSTDVLHAGAECGLTTSEGRSVMPLAHLLSSWVAASGRLQQCSVEVTAGHRTTTWSHPVVCCRWDCDCSNLNSSLARAVDSTLQYHNIYSSLFTITVARKHNSSTIQYNTMQ